MTGTDTEPGAAILAQIAALGPFFTLHTHDPLLPPAPPWRPVCELADGSAALLERVTAVRSYLAAAGGQPDGAVEPRVAASVTHLGIAARILSPALALAVLGNTRPLALTGMHWQPVPGGAFPLSLPREHLRPGSTRAPAPDRWAAALVEGPLRELVVATGALSVSPRVLWGNVASAINGATAVLSGAAPAHARGARELAALLLAQPLLRDAAAGAAGTSRFQRRNCCLIYRAAPKGAGAVCGDCVLTRR